MRLSISMAMHRVTQEFRKESHLGSSEVDGGSVRSPVERMSADRRRASVNGPNIDGADAEANDRLIWLHGDLALSLTSTIDHIVSRSGHR
jgi:hypothetical protein